MSKESLARRCGWAMASCLMLAVPQAWAQVGSAGTPSEQSTTQDDASSPFKFGLQLGMNLVSERNLYWNLSETFATEAGFDPDATWLEWYLKPGVSFDMPQGDWNFFGKASAVLSGTQGTDAYAARNTSELGLEEAYLGMRRQWGDATSLESSIGPRELRFGTGMLISNGGSNGFERGALKLGPRKAWDLAALLRLKTGRHTATLARISPNELDSSENGNRIVALDWRYDSPDDAYIGATAARVPRSASPYPQAAAPGNPPIVIAGGRQGLEVLDVYGRTPRIPIGSARLAFTGEIAIQRNDRIDMNAWGGRLQAELGFPDVQWSPTLLASAQVFSGDDPGSSSLERFDPLYYDGSPSSWASGSKSAMVFINSNLRAFHLALRVAPTQQDTLTLRYAHVRAQQLFSPLQFGQATRLDFANGTSSLVTGVTDPHLSDDLFLEYMRIASRNVFIGSGVSVSRPGRGIRIVVPGTTPNWIGAYANVVFQF